jgi:hypothetical protein
MPVEEVAVVRVPSVPGVRMAQAVSRAGLLETVRWCGSGPGSLLPTALDHSAVALAQRQYASGDRRRCRDDTQFDLLLALAPCTVHAEAWRQGRRIFSAKDTGTALWIAVTPQEEVQLMARLAALGVPQTAFHDPTSQAAASVRPVRQGQHRVATR